MLTATPANEETGNNPWHGLKTLTECLFGLFMDAESELPAINCLDDDKSTDLRNALLLAVSSIKSQAGASPPMVINAILFFAENIRNDYWESADDMDVDRSSQADSTVLGRYVRYDDSLYRAVLLIAMSNIRVTSSFNPTEILNRIKKRAMYELHRDMTDALAAYRSGDVPAIMLPGGGVVSAAALSCLGEVDSQSADGNSVDYESYFLPEKLPKYQMVYESTVRMAALEAYVRLCFARYVAVKDADIRAINAGSKRRSTGVTPWAATGIIAVCAVIESDESKAVQAEAAVTLLEAVLNRPPRIALRAISLGEYLCVNGLYDPSGYSATPPPISRSRYDRRDALRSNSVAMRAAMQRLWAVMSGPRCAANQVRLFYVDDDERDEMRTNK